MEILEQELRKKSSMVKAPVLPPPAPVPVPVPVVSAPKSEEKQQQPSQVLRITKPKVVLFKEKVPEKEKEKISVSSSNSVDSVYKWLKENMKKVISALKKHYIISSFGKKVYTSFPFEKPVDAYSFPDYHQVIIIIIIIIIYITITIIITIIICISICIFINHFIIYLEHSTYTLHR